MVCNEAVYLNRSGIMATSFKPRPPVPCRMLVDSCCTLSFIPYEIEITKGKLIEHDEVIDTGYEPLSMKEEAPKLMGVSFQQEIPYQHGLRSYTSYERYKGAKTKKEALNMGATLDDLERDLDRGHLQLNQHAEHIDWNLVGKHVQEIPQHHLQHLRAATAFAWCCEAVEESDPELQEVSEEATSSDSEEDEEPILLTARIAVETPEKIEGPSESPVTEQGTWMTNINTVEVQVE